MQIHPIFDEILGSIRPRQSAPVREATELELRCVAAAEKAMADHPQNTLVMVRAVLGVVGSHSK